MPGRPAESVLCGFLYRRSLRELPDVLQRGKQCYVARRPAQRHEKVDVGRPWPDSFDPLQFQPRRDDRRPRHSSQVQIPNCDLLGNADAVRRLLAREPKPGIVKLRAWLAQ